MINDVINLIPYIDFHNKLIFRDIFDEIDEEYY